LIAVSIIHCRFSQRLEEVHYDTRKCNRLLGMNAMTNALHLDERTIGEQRSSGLDGLVIQRASRAHIGLHQEHGTGNPWQHIFKLLVIESSFLEDKHQVFRVEPTVHFETAAMLYIIGLWIESG
jgi:hypothetical protein